MYAIKIILWTIFTLGSSYGVDLSTDKLQKRWISAISIDKNPNYVKDELITVPENTFQKIIQINFLDNNFNLHRDCLIYYIPSKKGSGKLKVVSLSVGQKCEEVFMAEPVWEHERIYNFAYGLKENKLILKIDSELIEFSLLNMKYSKSTKYNLRVSLFDSKRKGISLEEGDICFDIDDKCLVTKSNICDLCPGAVMPVIGSQCQKTTRKYCLTKVCGEQHGPACIRGFKATQYNENYCIMDSPIGFCQKPYRVVCVDGELLCR